MEKTKQVFWPTQYQNRDFQEINIHLQNKDKNLTSWGAGLCRRLNTI